MHLLYQLLQFQQLVRRQHGRQCVKHLAPVGALEQFAFGSAVGVTQ